MEYAEECKNGDKRLPEVHMLGQGRAAHSATECSVGEDTHVQILHCVCSCRKSREGQRCRNECFSGNTGPIRFSKRPAEFVRLEGKERAAATLTDPSMS